MGGRRILTALLLAGVASARAEIGIAASVTYALAGEQSMFEWGCFEPCKCPVASRTHMTGTFELRPSSSDPLYEYYDVLDVRWRVEDSTQPLVITGSGTYRRGGEVARSEQMTLDVSINGWPAGIFDSGLVPAREPFPAIALRMSIHGEFCFDSVLAMVAKPVNSTTGVEEAPTALTLDPNPTRAAAEIGFTLREPRGVDLAIFDTAGRRLRTVTNERLGAGTYRRTWDGRLSGGAEAPAGLYLVRIELGSERATRRLVKLP